MEDKLELTKSQVEAIIKWAYKSGEFIKNVETNYNDIYFECMKDTPDFYYNVNEFGEFIKSLREFVGEE